jgi:hypothetical protein
MTDVQQAVPVAGEGEATRAAIFAIMVSVGLGDKTPHAGRDEVIALSRLTEPARKADRLGEDVDIAGWQHALDPCPVTGVKRWIYAIAPTEEQARRDGAGAFNTRQCDVRPLYAALPDPTHTREAEYNHPRECQSIWRCAIGDFVGALDVLKNQWTGSRRKADREAGAKLSGVLDLVWAARDPAPGSYFEASKLGKPMIERIRAALSAGSAQ